MDLHAAGIERFEARFGLGQHAARDYAVMDEGLNLLLIQCGNKVLVLVQDACLVRKQDELFGLERPGNGPCYQVGVDIICLSLNTDTDGCGSPG